ncbi:MAG: class I tRNA ligase family protein, partial [Novosphingobium sp.]
AGFLVPHIVTAKDGEVTELDAEPRTVATPFGDRGGVVIEPWLTDQWYVDAATLAKPPMEAVRDGRIEIVPKTWEKTYFNWMENIQPWCVSRQLWWGHRIPAWYGPTKEFMDAAEAEDELTQSLTIKDNATFVSETRKAAIADAISYYGPKYTVIFDDVPVSKGTTHSETYVYRDEDVLDTWFSSALWPFATLGWPDGDDNTGSARAELVEAPGAAPANPAAQGPSTGSGRAGTGDGGSGDAQSLYARHYPNDLLISGFDILFFWCARMAMQGMHFNNGTPPWKRLYLHGLVRAADGQKMSKSKGNVVDPLLLIDQYGADALRFFMAAMESQGRDVKMDERRVEGYRNFATKLWNAARFCQSNGIAASTSIAAPVATSAVNKWIIGEVVETLAELDTAMAELRFDAAANTIYHFVWDQFCDWYIELVKGNFDDETKAVAGWVLDQILVMLHPFMPFVTEELWASMGDRAHDGKSWPLITAKWPEPSASVDPAAKREVEWLIALVGNLRTAKNELGIAPGAKLDAFLPEPSATTRGIIERNAAAIDRLARLTSIQFAPAPAGAAMQIGAGDANIIIPLEGVVDIAAEKTRLAKALEVSTKEAKSLEGRLNNPSFVEKAKPEAVEKARADHAAHAAEAERLAAALSRLG